MEYNRYQPTDMNAASRKKSISWSDQPHVCFSFPEEDDDVSCITSPSTIDTAMNKSHSKGAPSNPSADAFCCSGLWDDMEKIFAFDDDEDDTFLGSLISYESCSWSQSITDGCSGGSRSLQDSEHSDAISNVSSVSSGRVDLAAGIVRKSSNASLQDGGIPESGFVLMDEDSQKLKLARRPSLLNKNSLAKSANRGAEAKAIYRVEVVLAEKPKRSVATITRLLVDAKAKQMKAKLSALNCMQYAKPMLTVDDSREEAVSSQRE